MTGRIQKALSGFYYVDTGGTILRCRARGKFRKEGISPLVGDQAEVRELGNGEGFVERILPRRNAFSRPAVANIDQLVVIASAAVPKTDPFLIDRVAAIAALKKCRVIVVLSVTWTRQILSIISTIFPDFQPCGSVRKRERDWRI